MDYRERWELKDYLIGQRLERRILLFHLGLILLMLGFLLNFWYLQGVNGREYADLSTNISEGGIFIKNFSPPPVGTAITLTVKLPEEWGSHPMKIVGRVAHINDDPDPHKRGMGIEFLSVSAETVPMIQYFVREIYSQDDLTLPGRLGFVHGVVSGLE